jgi:hypothetical protein
MNCAVLIPGLTHLPLPPPLSLAKNNPPINPPTNQPTNPKVVFIGVGMDEAAITAALDACLLDDGELAAYKAHYVKPKDE